MIDVKFKNLNKSEIAIETVEDRLLPLFDKFPDLQSCRTTVTLEMHNSPVKAGPDLFTVRAFISRGRYKKICLQKSASNLYVALANLVEHMLERLNRFGDRTRVRNRNHARRLQKFAKMQAG